MSTTTPRNHRSIAAAAVVMAVVGLAATAIPSGAAPPPLRLGAVFPLHGDAAEYAADERLGIDIARSIVNSSGGIAGRQVDLEVADASDLANAAPAVDRLQADGVPLVIGAFSSDLSIPTSARAQQDGMVYWESGAVADQLTGRGLPLVFRVGASGSNLGDTTASFAATQLLPMLGKTAGAVRVSLVVADDAYAHSVADAASSRLQAAGMQIVSQSVYTISYPQWDRVLGDLRRAQPDLLVLASHIPDGEAFTRAFMASGIRVGAFLGSTMAQCEQEFGDALGQTAVGVFASDRPGEGFDPARLPTAQARADFARMATMWRAMRGTDPTEEGVSGFTAAWALLHDVLPAAARHGEVTAQTIAAAAREADLPKGTLPNGAGLRFAGAGSQLGQNLRAAAVVWQWQAPRHSVVVWPPEYATGATRLVPLGS
jgi:branched-chain amino acid transport system substrate-binding protein